MDVNKCKGSRCFGFEPLQKVLEAKGTRLEAMPGVRYLRCSGEAAWCLVGDR